MAKYIVTGGAGFIGSNLVHDLVRKGHDVVVVDPLHTGSRELIRDVPVCLLYTSPSPRDS